MHVKNKCKKKKPVSEQKNDIDEISVDICHVSKWLRYKKYI